MRPLPPRFGLAALLVLCCAAAAAVLGADGALSEADAQGAAPRFVGPQERSAGLCSDEMLYVPAGSFRGGGTSEQVNLSDNQPDIVRDPRPRGQFSTEHYCIDRHEFPGEGRRPLAHVTWLQARVACEAVGKRLCSEDEWAKACGGPLGWLLPYGDTYVPGLCHADIQEEGAFDAVVAAGSRPACASPYGALDQEGNVSEWVEDRRPIPGKAGLGGRNDDRWVLGGTMWPGVYGRGCQARHAHPQVAPVAGDDGFRCCRSVGGR